MLLIVTVLNLDKGGFPTTTSNMEQKALRTVLKYVEYLTNPKWEILTNPEMGHLTNPKWDPT